MIPYFVFCIIGILITLIKNVLISRQQETIFEYLIGAFFWMDYSHLQHYGFVLWFLPALLWARLISFSLLKFPDQYWPLALIACIFVCAAVASSHYANWPFAIDKGLVALPWVYGGNIFYRFRAHFLPAKIPSAVVLCCVLLGSLAIGGIPIVNMSVRNVGNLWLTLPYTLSVIGLMITFAYFIHANKSPGQISKCFTWLGINSMLIFVFHPYTNHLAYLICGLTLHEHYWAVIFILSFSMLILIMLIRGRYPQAAMFKWIPQR